MEYIPYSAIFSRHKYLADWPSTSISLKQISRIDPISHSYVYTRTPQTASSQTRFRQYTCRPRTVSTTPCSAGSAARFPTSAFSSGMNLAYRPLFVGSVASWASNMCQTSTLAEAMVGDSTVFESRPRGSGSIVSELLLEVAIQPFPH